MVVTILLGESSQMEDPFG